MVCIKSVRIRFMPSIPRLMSFLHIFLILKAMAKKAKSIVTLSFPKWRKRRYAISYFICPKTASGSMHRRPLCLIPSREVSLSLVFIQPVVDLYDASVRLCLVTPATEWASIAVLGPIACAFGDISACGLSPVVPTRSMCCPMRQT